MNVPEWAAIRWFLLFLARAVSQRKGRVIMASFSVALAVAMITALIGINFGIGEKLGSELRSYGANIIVSSKEGAFIDAAAIDKIRKITEVEDAAGQVLGRAFVDGRAIEIIGVDIESLRKSGWRFLGKRPEKGNEVLAGINLKDALKLDQGGTLSLEGGGGKSDFVVSGFVERGGPEDNSVIMPIETAWRLTGTDGKFSVVLARGRSGELDRVAGDISESIPGVRAKTLRQVALAEESLLMKMQLLMTLVSVIVLFASLVSVASTMSANVLERRREIGLMKAIGGTRAQISFFYAAEAVIMGLSGGLAGFLAGYVSAQAISKGAFNSFIGLPQWAIIFSLAAGLTIALTGSHFPVRNAVSSDPAAVLRGE